MSTETTQVNDASPNYFAQDEAHDIPPGYKRSELGLIPRDWRVAKIGTIGEVGRGRVISHREIERANSPTYPVYSSQTVNEGIMGYLDTYDFEGEYVTWTTDGANAGTVFHRNGRFNCTNVCGTIRLRRDDAYFVARALSVVAYRYVSRNLGNPKLMNDVAKQIPIALPSRIEEQYAIAEALTDVDGLLGALEALIAKKRAIKQAAMQHLLTGKTRLPGFTGEWEMKQLAEDVTLLSGHHVMARYCNSRGVGTPYLTGPADFPEGRIQQTKFTEKPTTLCRLGDILVTVKGSGSGTLIEADAKYCISRQLMAIRPSCWNARFLFYSLLQNASSIAAASTGLIPGLSRADILEQELPLPADLSEQTAVATVLSDMDDEIAALEARRDKTRAIKQGMMQQLLTGRVRLVKPSPAEAGS